MPLTFDAWWRGEGQSRSADPEAHWSAGRAAYRAQALAALREELAFFDGNGDEELAARVEDCIELLEKLT